MKIVYFGTDVFISCFLYLADQHDIMALYTYHNNEDFFTEYSIVKEAKKRGIPVHYEDMTTQETRRLFTKEGCELFFVAEYNRILPVPEGLTVFRGINIHSSLLPVGRSYYPIEMALENQLTQTGVTMHKISAILDSGDILDARKVDITENMDSIDIYIQCGYCALEMLKLLMQDFEYGWNKGTPQPKGHHFPYWKRPGEELLTIVHTMTRAQAMESYRKFNQLTQIYLHEKKYYIRAMSAGTALLSQDLITLDNDRFLFRVADGHLRLIIFREGEG